MEAIMLDADNDCIEDKTLLYKCNWICTHERSQWCLKNILESGHFIIKYFVKPKLEFYNC